MRKVLMFLALIVLAPMAMAEPPFGGTVYVEADVITDNDPSTFRNVAYTDLVEDTHWDHRLEDTEDEGENTTDYHRFTAMFRTGNNMQIDVNSEFGSAAKAEKVARIYAYIVGQMPALMRANMRQLVIHKTGDDWSANAEGHMTIHHGNYAGEKADGALEESMFHEGGHTTIDALVEGTWAWKRAVRADGEYISTYAKDSDGSEDVAESFLMYYAWAMRPDRLDPEDLELIEAVMPNRLKYFQKKFPPSKLGL